MSRWNGGKDGGGESALRVNSLIGDVATELRRPKLRSAQNFYEILTGAMR